MRPIPELRESAERLTRQLAALEALGASAPAFFSRMARAEAERLTAIVERAAPHLTARTDAPSLELEANAGELFEPPAILPPESVLEGRWRFEPIRFRVKAEHLFVHALTFKGSRTIRIKHVRLIFADGGETLHDRWTNMENGNGKEFDKRDFLPWLSAHPGEPEGPARRLAVLEILGSAQDQGFSAAIDLRVRIPDPAYDASPAVAEICADLIEALSGQPAESGSAARARAALTRLDRLLGLAVIGGPADPLASGGRGAAPVPFQPWPIDTRPGRLDRRAR
jgi:hypothetical protein